MAADDGDKRYKGNWQAAVILLAAVLIAVALGWIIHAVGTIVTAPFLR